LRFEPIRTELFVARAVMLAFRRPVSCRIFAFDGKALANARPLPAAVLALLRPLRDSR
jgi:hypothetical protein